jgi:hypothetical protein
MEQKAQKHSGFRAWRVVNHTDAVVKRARVMGKNHSACSAFRSDSSFVFALEVEPHEAEATATPDQSHRLSDRAAQAISACLSAKIGKTQVWMESV